MKKLLTSLFIFYLLPLFAVSASLSTNPSRPVAGERFVIVLTVDSPDDFTFSIAGKVPENMQINSNYFSSGQQRYDINGKRTFKAFYYFAASADKPGKYTIPPFELDSGKEKIRTKPLTVVIGEKKAVPESEKLHAEFEFSPDRPVYTGENVELVIDLSIPEKTALAAVPQIKPESFPGAVFYPLGRQNEKFVQLTNPRRQGNMIFLQYGAKFQVQKSGSFRPACEVILPVQKDNSGGFFLFSTVQYEQFTIRAEKELQILPRPAAPADTIDTGLTGSWQITGKISKNSLRAGDISEIILTFRGEEPSYLFHAPQLSLKDARLYPPEVKTSDDRQNFTVKYPFVAMKAGDFDPSFKLAFFDPAEKKFKVKELNFNFSATANPDLVHTPPPPETSGQEPVKAELAPFSLLPADGKVSTPLIKNVLLPVILLPVAAFVLMLTTFMPHRKKDRKRQLLTKELSKLAKDLPVSGKEALRQAGAAGIAAAMDLPEGSGFTEIARHIPDPEVAGFFRELEESSYAPGIAGVTPSDPRILAKTAKFIKKLLTLAVFFWITAVNGADFDSAKAAFLRGDYQAAAVELRQLNQLNGNDPDPALWFDQGCAEYMLGNYSAAWVCFSRASLLAPREKEYAGAVKLAADKINIVEKNVSVLDYFRPDDYIMTAAVFLAIALVFIALRKKMPLVPVVGAAIFSLLLASFLLFAALQRAKAYDPSRAMVIAPDAALCAVPMAKSGKSAALPEGTILQLKEENNGFIRVESDNVNGWVRKTDLWQIFPWGVF